MVGQADILSTISRDIPVVDKRDERLRREIGNQEEILIWITTKTSDNAERLIAMQRDRRLRREMGGSVTSPT
jgi:hypothetical protein